MSAVGIAHERQDRPAFVTFEKIAVEDKAASLKAGHWVGKDVDYVRITPPYSKDVIKFKIPQWIDNMKQDVRQGRLPQEWMDGYLKKYEMWKNGQEIPLDGTAIKGWGVISPAQQEKLVSMNILTVEDLAGMNDEGLKRVGMGAYELKNKATAWLKQLGDRGPLTMEMAAVKQENAVLRGSVDSLEQKVKALESLIQSAAGRVSVSVPDSADIEANDILPEPEPTPVRRKAKDVTI